MSDTQSIKYRLIGATVIVVSFVLAWWLLLDHDIKRHQSLDTSRPEPIKVERFDIQDPQVPANAEKITTQPVQPVSVSKQSKEKAAKPTAPKAKTDKPATKPKATAKAAPKTQPKKQPAPVKKPAPAKKQTYSKLNDKGLPEAWVLQLGSFKEKPNAQQLQKKLLKHDFPAYVKAFNLSSGKIYRVLVGPKLSKSRAEKMSRQIKQKLGLKSMLVTFKPGFEE